MYYQAESLGAGGFGCVWKIYNDDGDAFAGKVFEPADDGSLDPGTLREISILKFLGSQASTKNVCPVIDITTLPSTSGEGVMTPTMVMPLFAGSLENQIEKGLLKGPGQGTAKTQIAYGIITGIASLHRAGIIHRDIKSANVLLDELGDPCLCDFSLARLPLLSSSPSKREGRKKPAKKKLPPGTGAAKMSTGIGTAGYIAPEVYFAEKTGLVYNTKADIWSAGVVLLEIFTDRLMVEKDKAAYAKIAEYRKSFSSKPIPAMLCRMLAENPDDRPSAAEILASGVFGPASTDDTEAAPGVMLPPGTAIARESTTAIALHCAAFETQFTETELLARSIIARVPECSPMTAVLLATKMNEVFVPDVDEIGYCFSQRPGDAYDKFDKDAFCVEEAEVFKRLSFNVIPPTL